MTKTRFWTADVRWEDEPRPEELRRLHSLLASDPKLALQGLQELSEQGSLAATLYIAIHLDSSAVDEHDEEESVRWYEKAAKQGLAQAQFNFGACYEKGIGVKQDAKQALDWYKKAAAQGNEQAKTIVTRLEKGLNKPPPDSSSSKGPLTGSSSK